MLNLDYTARRSDGTTISQLRGLILSEQATIDNLESRIANGLPAVDKIPYVGPALPNAIRKPLEDR